MSVLGRQARVVVTKTPDSLRRALPAASSIDSRLSSCTKFGLFLEALTFANSLDNSGQDSGKSQWLFPEKDVRIALHTSLRVCKFHDQEVARCGRKPTALLRPCSRLPSLLSYLVDSASRQQLEAGHGSLHLGACRPALPQVAGTQDRGGSCTRRPSGRNLGPRRQEGTQQNLGRWPGVGDALLLHRHGARHEAGAGLLSRQTLPLQHRAVPAQAAARYVTAAVPVHHRRGSNRTRTPQT